MKRHAFSALLTLILGLGTFAVSDAQWRGRGPGSGGPMFGGRGPMGFPGVELTDAQRKQIRAILKEERTARQDAPRAFDLHQQLRAELLADAPDQQKVALLRDQIAAAHAQRLAEEIALQQKLVEVLTFEQRAQARDALAKRAERLSQRQPQRPGGLPGQVSQ